MYEIRVGQKMDFPQPNAKYKESKNCSVLLLPSVVSSFSDVGSFFLLVFLLDIDT